MFWVAAETPVIILILRSPLWGWLLKGSWRVIPPLVVHRVLAAAWLRASLSPLFGKAAERVLSLVGCSEFILALVRVIVLTLLDRLARNSHITKQFSQE